jgi:hypothetical protein
MKIHKVTFMICEHCKHMVYDVTSYDDYHFHKNVIPDMECPKCKKKAS